MVAAIHNLDPHANELVEKAVELAKGGDVGALRSCLERLIPPAESAPVNIGGLKGTLAEQASTLMGAIVTGNITPDEGVALLQALSAQARVMEVGATPGGDISMELSQNHPNSPAPHEFQGHGIVTNTECGSSGRRRISGAIDGDTVDFSSMLIYCRDPNTLLGFPAGIFLSYPPNEAVLSGNTISGRYLFNFGDTGTFSLTRSINTITTTVEAGGAIVPAGPVLVDAGTSQTFTITPAAGFSILDVRVNDASVGAVPAFTFPNVGANHIIEAQFVANKVIAASAGPNGRISPSGDIIVTEGADQLFTITPDPGYFISDVIVDGNSAGSVRSFAFTNVTSEHTIETSFSEVYPAIAPALQLLMDDEGAQ